MATRAILSGLILALQTPSNPLIATCVKQFPIFPLFILLSVLREVESSLTTVSTTCIYC